MEPPALILIFFALCGAGILVSVVAPRLRHGHVLAWLGSFAAIALVLAGARGLLAGATFSQSLWTLPHLATLTIHFDRISATFLILTGFVLLPASIFAGGEINRAAERRNGSLFAGLMFSLYASIALVFIAGDAVLFLLAWEAMSVLSYLLIAQKRAYENGHVDAGYLLLSLGEAGTLAVAFAFLVLGVTAGSMEFPAMKVGAEALSGGVKWLIFLLSLFGFGVKAGIVPVNFWLPRAYTVAPRAFVPVLAGATLNLGLYGILRVNMDIVPATLPGPGLVTLIIGTFSALVGILYATTDNDLKTMLAHSSIENAGIIAAGFGAGMVFVSTNHHEAAAIAFTAALYHLINHSLYKTLLFFGVGTVETQTGTRDMDKLGGLIRWMPLTALFFLAGTLSIAALPPFNGFVSEWLTLQMMLRSSELASTGPKIIFALCGAGLALTAALAVTCFVKVFAMSFLGIRRLDDQKKLAEPKRTALVPMAILAALCLIFGVLPTYIIPALEPVLDPLAGASPAEALVPPFFAGNSAHGNLPPAFVEDFHNLGAQVGQSVLPGRGLVVLHRGGTENPVVFAMSTAYTLIALIVLLVLAYVIIRLWLTPGRKLSRRERWDGGVRRLLPEMTYTATGFSNPVRVIFDAVFRPTTIEDTRETVAEHFRTAIRHEKERVYLMDKLVLQPVSSAAMACARLLAAIHHGRFNTYAAYTLLALLVALVVALLF